jgi:PAS domain S-box-containing protein
MKRIFSENLILITSIFLGIVIGVIDSVLDFFLFYSGSFWDLLIFNVPKHEVYIRTLIFFMFFLFGFYIQVLWKRKERLIYSIKQSKSEIESIFRAAPVGIGYVIDRKIQRVNQRFCDMLGYNEDELVGKNSHIVYPSMEDYEYVGKEKYRQISEKGTGTVETRLKRKDGKIIHVILSSTPIDLSDLSMGVTFTALDISQRVKMEKDLLESEERFRLMFENSKAIMLLINPANGKIVQANKSAITFYSYSMDQFKNELYIQQINTLSEKEVKEEMDRARIGDKSYFNFKHKLADGNSKVVEVYSNKIMVKGKELLFSIIHDISDRVKANKELQKYRLHLEEMVSERTAELEEKNKELEKFNEVFVSREFRIKELKDEIEQLKQDKRKK